jgi:DNA-nicking Smr family endonuclease
MSRRTKGLTREDQLLWSKVARSVAPMKGRTVPAEPDEGEDAFAAGVASPDLPPVMAEAKHKAENLRRAADRPAGFDRPTRKKLAKGRVPIDGKIDLHGMTQSEAYGTLLSFLHNAYAHGRRHVLVVTGRGASMGSDGILRRQVPQWFATPAFRGLVSAHEDAARHHGGQGALYVRLRRRPGEPA